jgi:hypothetical protein
MSPTGWAGATTLLLCVPLNSKPVTFSFRVSTTRPFKAGASAAALAPALGGDSSVRGNDYATRAKLRLLMDKMSMQTSEGN